jgi:hypothetical protein
MTYLPRSRRGQHLKIFDPAASAYFEAAGITDITERAAWNNFVVEGEGK